MTGIAVNLPAARRGGLMRLVPLVLGREWRRPAAWIAAGCAAAAGMSADPLVAAAVGGLAAVAGMGDTVAEWPPQTRRLAGGVRVAIPLLACVAGAVVAAGAAAALGLFGILGILVAAVSMALARAASASAADAATATLVSAASGLGVARAADLSGPAAAAVIAGVGLALAAGAAWWERRGTRPAAAGLAVLPRTTGLTIGRGPLPASGPTRRLLGLMGMISVLAAMADGLLLSPEHAAMATAITLVWFLGLAMPAALLQDGEAMRAAWDRLVRSSAAEAASVWGPYLGWLRIATRVTCGHAAVLGWPAVVAFVVGLASPGSVRPAGITLAAVCGAAAAIVGVALLSGFFRFGCETAFAIAVALVVACLWAAPSQPAVNQGRPEPLRFCVRALKADVEHFAASCQTRQVDRPPAAINTGEFPCTDLF